MKPSIIILAALLTACGGGDYTTRCTTVANPYFDTSPAPGVCPAMPTCASATCK